MRRLATTLMSLVVVAVIASPALAQEEGDYRTRDSGDWSMAQIWERYNGSAWAAIGTPPAGSETITVLEADSVFVDAATTITGRLVNQGIVEADSSILTVEGDGIYEHARDAGSLPPITWAEDATLLMSALNVATAPEDRNQNYFNLTFDTDSLLANLNMDLDSVTVGGDIHVITSGPFSRWYLTSALANEGSTVTIEGDVIVEDGAFSVQGTSNANTTFIVHHHGNIDVTGGNFSISRGSQGNGTTTWYLYEGDFSMSNATTQSSTTTPNGARFVFASGGTQTLTLENVTINNLPIEVSDSTTLDMGTSVMGGEGFFLLNEGGTLATAAPGGISDIFAASIPSLVTLEDNSSFTFNGTETQVTSELMPAIVNNLTINNAAGVTLSQETTINGVLRLQAGVFDNTIPFTLGPEGSISEEGGSLAVPVSVEEEDGLPRAFAVEQNYPNPFRSSSVIRYALPEASDVSLTVFNVLGQKIRRWDEGRQPAGVHEFTFDSAGLSAGLYIYRVEAGDFVAARQMVLLE